MLSPPALRAATSEIVTPLETTSLGLVIIGRNDGERLARCLASVSGIPNRRRGLSAKLARASGILLMVGKLPQFLGLVGFHFDPLSWRASRLIEYKHRGTA
jgi:hypothetical protein